MNDLEKAKAVFKKGGLSCVLVKDENIYTSEKSGIKPLLEFIGDSKDYTGFCAADKIVGRAAAFCYVNLSVKEVWANVMSKEGKEILERHGISAFCDTLTDKIINRKGTDICPMDKAIIDIDSPGEALEILSLKVKSMM